MKTKTQQVDTAQMVSREFVRLYYNVMNSYSAYLYLFYEHDSTVVVSDARDDDIPISMQATTHETVQELLSWMYNDVSVIPLTCVPQISLSGSLLLLISGRITRKGYDQERFFTQALLLRKQEKGYYVKTDTLHVLSHQNSISYGLLPLSGKVSTQQKEIESEKLAEPTVKAYVGKHQPTDSCSEHHGDLASLVGKGLSPSTETAMAVTIKEFSENKVEVRTAVTSEKSEDENKGETPVCVNCYEGTKSVVESSPGGLPSVKGVNSTAVSTAPALPTPSIREAANRNEEHICDGLADQSGMPELTSLFAARLPIGITPSAVCMLFKEYGRLKKDNPVRVFTGLTNCYACVNFESEFEMRRALESDIKYGGQQVVTEIWKPRDRRGRRIGRSFTSRIDQSRRPYIQA